MTQRRKKKTSQIDFNQLIKIDQISLNVIKNKFEKKLLSADLNTVNIIEKKKEFVDSTSNMQMQFESISSK